MNSAWKKLAARIDALSLRERVILFLAVMVLAVAVADTVWVAPARLHHHQVRERFDANSTEMRQLQDELRLKALQPDPVRQAREALAAVQAQTESVNRSIGSLSTLAAGTTSLPDVLTHFLRQHKALTLIRTASVTVDSPGLAGPGAQVGPAPTPVRRKGQELTVSGPYPDLVQYVRTLESAMPDLRWGALALKAEQQPPELTLRVFLVGSQP